MADPAVAYVSIKCKIPSPPEAEGGTLSNCGNHGEFNCGNHGEFKFVTYYNQYRVLL